MKPIQQKVDAWVGQFKEGYWSDDRILAQQTEEQGEIAEVLIEKSDPILATLPLMAQVDAHDFMDRVVQLGKLARAYSGKKGKPKKEIGPIEGLGPELADLLFSICCMANKHGIDLDVEFDKMMEKKLYGRDKDRFERK